MRFPRRGCETLRPSPRTFIYAAAVAALTIGSLAYTQLDEEHEESGLVAGDLVKVLVAVAALGVVAVASIAYLARKPPEEVA